MFKQIYNRILPTIIALSALSVSASAIFYSVYGLSKLFAGASTQVIIMTGTLEIAKLVVASLLYQYWSEINKILRAYLLLSCFVLMLITSGGIYGFLSSAYQETANKSEISNKELAVIDMKRDRFTEYKEEYQSEKQTINSTIKELRVSLSNPHQVQYIDRESGQLITTTSSSQRRALQKELGLAIEDRNRLNLKLEAATDSITKLDISVLNKESSNEAKQELGPLIYLSELTGKPMNIIVNWLLLLIIFVFDPLAIALVITANFAFNRLTPEEEITTQVERKAKQVKAPTPESNIPPPDIIEEKHPIDEMSKELGINPKDLTFKTIVPEGKEFNTPYPLSDIVKEPEEEIIIEDEEEDLEKIYNKKLSEQTEQNTKKKGKEK